MVLIVGRRSNLIFLVFVVFVTLVFLHDDEHYLVFKKLQSSSPQNSTAEKEIVWQVGNETVVMERLQNTKVPNMNGTLGRACQPTTQIQLKGSPFNERIWTMKTYNGITPKDTGGDEFYVTYTEPSTSSGNSTKSTHVTAAALIIDRKDGTYALEFVTSPMNKKTESSTFDSDGATASGTITIYFEYTCGIGFLAPPSKKTWSAGGAINEAFHIENVQRPRMSPFTFQNPSNINLTRYDVIEAIGDSLIRQFATESGRNEYFNYTKCADALSNDTLSFFLECSEAVLSSYALKNRTDMMTMEKRGAVIVGHSVWDILSDEEGKNGQDFEDHLEACRQYIQHLRRIAPQFDILWKSGTAMQIHEVKGKDWFHIDRVFYMSSSRARHLYELQMKLMNELNVPVLDVYELTYFSAEWLEPGDGRHYLPSLTRHLVDMFFQ